MKQKLFIKIISFYVVFFFLSDLEGLSNDGLYFSYTHQELEALQAQPIPNQIFTQESFTKWDPLIYQLTYKDKRVEGEAKRFMAYFYVAQRDFALLSFRYAKQWAEIPVLF